MDHLTKYIKRMSVMSAKLNTFEIYNIIVSYH